MKGALRRMSESLRNGECDSFSVENYSHHINRLVQARDAIENRARPLNRIATAVVAFFLACVGGGLLVSTASSWEVVLRWLVAHIDPCIMYVALIVSFVFSAALYYSRELTESIRDYDSTIDRLEERCRELKRDKADEERRESDLKAALEREDRIAKAAEERENRFLETLKRQASEAEARAKRIAEEAEAREERYIFAVKAQEQRDAAREERAIEREMEREARAPELAAKADKAITAGRSKILIRGSTQNQPAQPPPRVDPKVSQPREGDEQQVTTDSKPEASEKKNG